MPAKQIGKQKSSRCVLVGRESISGEMLGIRFDAYY